jgi:hypothetical protein
LSEAYKPISCLPKIGSHWQGKESRHVYSDEVDFSKSLSMFQLEEIWSVAQRRALTFYIHDNK